MPASNAAQIASAVFAAFAMVIALLAWRTSLRSLRTSFRPLLRPIPLFAGGQLTRTTLLLKNYGRGTAFGVKVYEDSATFLDAPPIATVDVVEPLGSGSKESERVGRVQLALASGHNLADGKRFRILYQDLEGTFHETELSVVSASFRARFSVRNPAGESRN